MEECCGVALNGKGINLASKAVFESDAESLADLFGALGDQTRIKILTALGTGELCVCELVEVLSELSQSAISHQLRLLRGARLVKSRRQGRQIFYSLDDEHVNILLAQAQDHVDELKG